MNKRQGKVIDILQVAYTSEWALVKFFSALFEEPDINEDIRKYYNLVGVCGGEKTKRAVLIRLLKEITYRKEALEEAVLKTESDKEIWRLRNTLTEMINSAKLIIKFSKNLTYYRLCKESHRLPLAAYEECDAVSLFAPNPTHHNYLEDIINAGKHILCEKPVVTVTDSGHRADRRNLDKLIELNKKRLEKGLIALDAEHYSSKKSSKIFFDNIEKLVDKYGEISYAEGHLEEIDNPEKIRTRKLLSRGNQTGLLADTGIHLISIITNINGNIGKILKRGIRNVRRETEYDIYPENGYNVETAAHVNFEVSGRYFAENATAYISVEKFIDKKKKKQEKENKSMTFTFVKKNKKTKVTINFADGTVNDPQKICKQGKREYSSNEYVNILRDFYEAITLKREPVNGSQGTSFTNSIKNLDAIYRIYKQFPVEENLVEIYKR